MQSPPGAWSRVSASQYLAFGDGLGAVGFDAVEGPFNSHLESVATYIKKGNVEEADKFQDFTIKVYLFMVIG
ncbi:hypothetical protein L195_g032444 [Trifolium pratense]|uniref:Uncharacterized protein n=1 Tax=Trifolium pratense TaxID=57577 RepID=A0A2K3LD77_TRIPR|nr:hypothetical protein L195_g032444 [Trifolium pratense]